MTDPGETPEQAAARELREETGFIAKRFVVWPPSFTSPGLANEVINIVEAEVDESAPENADPQTDFDPSEMIETIFVPRAGLPDYYRAETAKGVKFDARVAMYAITLMRG